MDIYLQGANSYGQLGQGTKTDTPLPIVCDLSLPEGTRLSAVTGGGGHTVVLTAARTVFVFGWNKDGQLGLGHTDDVMIPRYLELTASIAKVACGWNHTLAITCGGTLLAWGSNAYGQLGLPEKRRQLCPVEVSQKLFGGSILRDVAAGLRHSLAVTGQS